MLWAFLCVAFLSATAIAIPVETIDDNVQVIENEINCTFTKKNNTIDLRKIFRLLDTDKDNELTYLEFTVLILTADDGKHTLPGGQTNITKELFEGAWTAMMMDAEIEDADDKACAYMKKADNCTKKSKYYQDGWLIIDTTDEGLEKKTGQEDEGRCVFNYMGGYRLTKEGGLPVPTLENPNPITTPPEVVKIADFCTNMKSVIMETNTDGACTNSAV